MPARALRFPTRKSSARQNMPRGRQKKKTKTGMQFAFVNLYSGDGIIELTVWPRVLSDYQDLIVKGSQVAVLGKKEDESHVIASDFKPYKQWLHDREIK